MAGIALDLSTKTGYAHTDGTSGLYLLPDGPNGKRWAAFYVWLLDFLKAHPVEWIACEASLHQPGNGARVANALHTMVECIAAVYGVAYKTYAASTIKKHATGSGRADKAMMWQAAVARGITWTPESDDVVDAIWLLDLALNDQDFT